MVETARNYGPPLLAWVLLLWLRPSPAPGRRLVRLCVLGLAVSQTALSPVVITVDDRLGREGWERLVAHLAMLLAVWAGAQLLLRLRGDDARARLHTAWAVGTGSLMVVLFALTPDVLPQHPWVMEYCIAYAVSLLPEFTVIARLCLHDARGTDKVLAAGLGLVVAGMVAATCYIVSKTVVAVAARASFDYSFGRDLLMSKALPTAAHLLVLVGVAVPATAEWLRRYRRYRRLRPLWLALYRTEPAIALEPPGLLHGARIFPTRLHLYRRVIEIRDGLLALRPHLPPAGAGLVRDDAAAIAAALSARERGTAVRPDGVPFVRGGQDLSSDTEYLCRLGDAFREVRRGA